MSTEPKFHQIFKAGKYPQGVWTPEQVRSVAQNYNAQILRAPITLDHEDKGPAYGWVEKLKEENGVLFAAFSEVTPELKEFVETGKYRPVSAEIFRDLEKKGPYLKAVTFLGAQMPQVKGLEPVRFWQAHEAEAADVFKLDSVEPEAESTTAAPVESVSVEKFNLLLSEVETLKTENKALAEKFAEVDAEKQKAQVEMERLYLSQRRNDFEIYLNERVAYGSLTPANKDKVLTLLTALSSVEKFSMKEGEEVNVVELFKEFIDSLPKLIHFGEIAKPQLGVSNADAGLNAQAMAFEAVKFQEQEREAGRFVSATDAVAFVKKQKGGSIG